MWAWTHAEPQVRASTSIRRGPLVEVSPITMIGLLPILPIVSFAMSSAASADEVVSTPKVAQVRLAETLADAEAIESVAAHGHAITFVVVREGETFDVTAQTKKSGEVITLTIARSQDLAAQLHGLTWLGTEMADVSAITRLVVDGDGAVTIATDDGRRYMAIPGRGSGGSANAAAEARWAAAWSNDDT
jgi:hypothetical protein